MKEIIDFLKNLVYHLNMSKTYTYPKIIIHGFSESLKRFMMNEYFEFDEKKASELDWFYHLTGGVTHTDFFAMRPTDYSKAGEGENWDDIF